MDVDAKSGSAALSVDSANIRTRAKEEHLVVAVSGHDLVHGHRSVFVVGVGSHHEGPPPQGVYGVEHDGMVPDKSHHVVRELLGGLDVRREGSTGTLEDTAGSEWTASWLMLLLHLN